MGLKSNSAAPVLAGVLVPTMMVLLLLYIVVPVLVAVAYTHKRKKQASGPGKTPINATQNVSMMEKLNSEEETQPEG